MNIPNVCPPHRWDENGAIEGIVLAKCIQCAVRQWHATDGDMDTWTIANKYNKRDHLEIVELKKRRFMDTTLKKETATGNPQGGNNDPPGTPDITVDPRIQRMQDNRGNSERFDKLAPQVLEDVKTMTWGAALRKNGIPVGSAGRLRRRWENRGLITIEPHELNTSHFDAQKDSIIADYHNPDIPIKQMQKKYHMTSNTWTALKKQWDIQPKGRHYHARNQVLTNLPDPLANEAKMYSVMNSKECVRQFLALLSRNPTKEVMAEEFQRVNTWLQAESVSTANCRQLLIDLAGFYDIPIKVLS